ncbi:DsbA family protein [Chloroflexota bacterium]
MWTKKYITSVALITIVILAIGGILWSSDAGSLATAPESEWQSGADDAPVTIDVYPDFTCHICVEKERLVLQALSLYPEKVRMVYHHYPISEFGQKLAEVLEAAGEQGKFWEMHDRLLQDAIYATSQLNAFAEEIGLNMEQFKQSLDSGKFSEKVEISKRQAELHGVDNVSVFINRLEYQHYPGTLSDLRAAIEEALNRSGADVND